jgi:hypothetical protein
VRPLFLDLAIALTACGSGPILTNRLGARTGRAAYATELRARERVRAPPRTPCETYVSATCHPGPSLAQVPAHADDYRDL